jgi:hypothetical protein
MMALRLTARSRFFETAGSRLADSHSALPPSLDLGVPAPHSPTLRLLVSRIAPFS